jgi:hypothetical protein
MKCYTDIDCKNECKDGDLVAVIIPTTMDDVYKALGNKLQAFEDEAIRFHVERGNPRMKVES